MSDTLQQASAPVDPMTIMQQAARGKYQYTPSVAQQAPNAAVTADPSIPMMTVRPTPSQTQAADAASLDPMAIMQQAARGKFKYTPPAPPPQQSTGVGLARNVGAALQEGAANLLNVAADPFGNLIGKPLTTLGAFAHDAIAPHVGGRRFTDQEREQLLGDTVPQPGTQIVNAIDTAGGAPTPEQVPSNGPLERIVRKGTGAALGMAPLGPAGVLTNAAMGAGGAIAGDQAAQMVPEWAQPATELAGNVAGNIAAGGAIQGATALARGAKNSVGNLGIGPKETIGDTRATGSQALTVGQKLLDAAGPEGQQAIEAATVLPGMGAPAAEIVEGSKPTTAQVAPTPGLVEMEKASRVANPAEYNALAVRQNNARIGAIRGLAPEEAEPGVLGQYFTQQLQDIDARHAGETAAGQAMLTQEGQRATQQARGAVQAATEGVGGQTAPDVTGEAIRGSLAERNAGARIAESKLWGMVDPDGKLTLPLGSVQQTAHSLMREVNPNLGDALGPQESLILKGAAALPEVVPFKQAQRLRSNIGQAERTLRATPGNEQSLRRLGMLKSSLDDAIANGVNAAGGNTLGQAGLVEGTNGLGNPGPGDRIPLPGGDHGPAAASGLPERVGGPGESQQVGGPAAGNSPVAAGAAAERLAQPQTLTDFLISRGGVKDQGGELRAADLQTVHHRMGGRLINNTRGMPLDYAREAAAEAGFIRPNADLNEFLDAVTSHQPVHRISEAADAALRTQQAREAALTSHARLNAGANIDDSIATLGVRLSPAEQEHAIDLHLQGLAPDDAVQQAARVGEENVLQRNAEYNAVGAPGMPLAARQAEMPELRGGGLTPNFDAEAAGRYAAARQATLERKQTFGQGPIGATLRPGRQGAEFSVENAAVARQFLTGNSTEPARVQQFIGAVGGEPEAVAAMRDALVSDLRKKGIVNDEGMVHPDKLNAWLKPEARGRTVDLFPGLRDDLGTAEAAQRTYDQTVADRAARLDAFNKQAAADHIAEVTSFKKTGGQFAAAEPLDALKRLFASKTRTQDFATVVSQAKGNPEVLDGLRRLTADYIEQRFSGARPSGEDTDFLNAAQFRKFIDDRREPLKAIFGGQGLQNLEAVAADLRRQARATAAPATPGSDTAQKLSAIRKERGGEFNPTAMAILSEQGGEVISHVLGAHEGVLGKLMGFGAGVGTLLLHTLKQAGISTKSDLIREAMLNPAVAKELMARASTRNTISPLAQRRIANALQASVIINSIEQGTQGPKKMVQPQ